jgi:hypothetical protein
LCKFNQLSRLIHNPRLKPKDFAKWLCLQVLANQVPRSGRVRLAIDWTSEEGFRDAKWYLGFAEARVKEIEAWSRLFAFSRRKGRCELSLVAAIIALVQQDRPLLRRFLRRLNSTWKLLYQICPDIRPEPLSNQQL